MQYADMKFAYSIFLLCCVLFTAVVAPAQAAQETPPKTGPTVPGNRAALKGRIAYAPANAPECVKRAIWATNYLTWRPYIWGGGHGSFYDRGYDCSGTISFFLHHAVLLGQPASSREFTNFGERGTGKWVTIYARNGHVYAVIAGLRLDTTGFRQEEGPRWRLSPRAPHGFVARHPAGL